MERRDPRALSHDELDRVCGGANQFLATLAATALNVLYPGSNCTAADGKVVCENDPRHG